jgi:hypothetical protein
VAAFTKLTAVFVGLVNLIIVVTRTKMALQFGRRRDVGQSCLVRAHRDVRRAIGFGCRSEEVERSILDKNFFVRYGVAIFALALGGK